ncbi:hypothetical protein B1218_35610 [Pseudomonas ogarae]|nr:hypothetical protein B1218_35610 [Pseudomonas ogarae]
MIEARKWGRKEVGREMENVSESGGGERGEHKGAKVGPEGCSRKSGEGGCVSSQPLATGTNMLKALE